MKSLATIVSRQATIPGGPGRPDPCANLLREIIDLLDTVSDLYQRALYDEHDLYKKHHRLKQKHPVYGSWEGHKLSHKPPA